MKLKHVTVSFDYVIVVPDDFNEDDCIPIAVDNVKEALNDMSVYDVDVSISDYKRNVVYGWDDKCIPYGGDGNTTIGEYL